MMGQLNPYPAYKDSGVPWLGEVPEHWGVRRLKQVARLNPGKTEARALLEQDAPVTFLPMERVYADGRIEATEHLPISSVWNGFTYFRRGDVIVAKITPCFENGKGACLDTLPTEVGFGSTEFHVLRAANSIRAPFLYRITTLPDFRRLGADEMTGAAGQQRVPTSFIANFTVPCPPLPEQTAIVRFLDYKDRRIRRYIRAKQKLIKLLEEYRKALIHQAVTGKIDVRTGKPYPAYKDSGVPWLGKVPEHWEVVPLKRLAWFKSGAGFPVHYQGETSAEIPFFKVSDMDLGQIAKPGPVPAISEGEVREIRVALPSAPEQTAIVEHLDAQTAKLDAAIAAARREIELLREYRERLIADVVTGKVDVRQVAAQLPEEPPEEEAGTDEEEPVAEELATVDSQEESNGEE
jgi:restriction endonuclease S subunit